jgi:hypothetical protein
VRGLADDHRREELAAEPRAAAGGDALLDDRDLDRGVLGELVGAREARGAGADDDDVALGVVVEVLDVERGVFWRKRRRRRKEMSAREWRRKNP